MNAYYDVSIKKWRLAEIERVAESVRPNGSGWDFVEGNIADKECINSLFDTYKPDLVVNLAAQAGVRYSITNPDAYIESNLIGFYNFWKHAVILMIMGKQECSIWFMQVPPVCMDQIRRFRIQRMTRWIIRFPYMRRRRSRMN